MLIESNPIILIKYSDQIVLSLYLSQRPRQFRYPRVASVHEIKIPVYPLQISVHIPRIGVIEPLVDPLDDLRVVPRNAILQQEEVHISLEVDEQVEEPAVHPQAP